MILRKWCEIKYLDNGRLNKRKSHINEYMCDECGGIYEESSKFELKYEKWKGHFCRECLKIKCIEKLKISGIEVLSKLTMEERKFNASMGGNATQKSPNRDVKSFTSDRWNKMNDEEKRKQVMTANNGLQEKLKNHEFKTAHFEKVFKNSKIGYISKGQREVLTELINENILGFELDGILSNMKVDVLNINKKIAIEYNGDYYHCNPRTWKPNDYNKSIKMFAEKKWELDRSRRFQLMRMGYCVVVIWESDWKKDKKKYINKIREKYYETT